MTDRIEEEDIDQGETSGRGVKEVLPDKSEPEIKVDIGPMQVRAIQSTRNSQPMKSTMRKNRSTPVLNDPGKALRIAPAT